MATAHATAVAELQEVADGAQVVLGGDCGGCAARSRTPATSEPSPAESTHHTARDAVAVAEAGRADRRAGADVGGEDRREEQARTERAAGHEEVAFDVFTAPRDPYAQRNAGDGVREEHDEWRFMSGSAAHAPSVGSASGQRAHTRRAVLDKTVRASYDRAS